MRRSFLGRNLVISLIIAALLACVTTAMAKPFYEGKTIKIITVHPPGGGYDTYARLSPVTWANTSQAAPRSS